MESETKKCPVEITCDKDISPVAEVSCTVDFEGAYYLQKFVDFHIYRLRNAAMLLAAVLSVTMYLTGFVLTAIVLFVIFYCLAVKLFTIKSRAKKYSAVFDGHGRNYSFYSDHVTQTTDVSVLCIDYENLRAVYETNSALIFVLPANTCFLIKKESCGESLNGIVRLLKDKLKDGYKIKNIK